MFVLHHCSNGQNLLNGNGMVTRLNISRSGGEEAEPVAIGA
jgi:hypothetical protein